MITIAVGLSLLWLALTAVLRVGVQLRRTGDTGLRFHAGSAGSAEWWAFVLCGASIVAVALAPILVAVGLVEPIPALDHPVTHALGIAAAATGVVVAFVAQLAMGASWRVGVDPTETTELVTGGVFGIVRNPIFTTMVVAAIGFALMVPNAVGIAAAVVLLGAVELQVRAVEEPHLGRQHGPAYAAYAGRVGRFLPGVGRLGSGVA